VAAPQIAFDDSEFETESSSVDKDSLGKYIKQRIKSVQSCYEKELKLNPTLKGKIVVRFVITTQGRVGEVSIDQNTMGNDNVAACIQRLVKTWTFPIKPEEDSPVTFPFVFSPGG
jgi:TonB family protein